MRGIGLLNFHHKICRGRKRIRKNGANGIRDIEGKVARVATSEREQQTSFKAEEEVEMLRVERSEKLTAEN